MTKGLKTVLLLAIVSFAAINVNGMRWISPYAYCAGNPVNAIDPDGRDSIH